MPVALLLLLEGIKQKLEQLSFSEIQMSENNSIMFTITPINKNVPLLVT